VSKSRSGGVSLTTTALYFPQEITRSTVQLDRIGVAAEIGGIFRVEKNAQDQFVIRCEGHLTLAAAPKIREELLAAIATNDKVVADVSQATDADLTFIQILIAAKRTASARGKTFLISAPENGVVMQKINCVGNPSGPTRNAGAHP
jgi:anti-anti-sigma regulatory factor